MYRRIELYDMTSSGNEAPDFDTNRGGTHDLTFLGYYLDHDIDIMKVKFRRKF